MVEKQKKKNLFKPNKNDPIHRQLKHIDQMTEKNQVFVNDTNTMIHSKDQTLEGDENGMLETIERSDKDECNRKSTSKLFDKFNINVNKRKLNQDSSDDLVSVSLTPNDNNTTHIGTNIQENVPYRKPFKNKNVRDYYGDADELEDDSEKHADKLNKQRKYGYFFYKDSDDEEDCNKKKKTHKKSSKSKSKSREYKDDMKIPFVPNLLGDEEDFYKMNSIKRIEQDEIPDEDEIEYLDQVSNTVQESAIDAHKNIVYDVGKHSKNKHKVKSKGKMKNNEKVVNQSDELK